jgi:hypothetical protein
MSPLVKRIGGLAALVLALGACDYGLVLDPDPADPGDTVTVTNAPDGPTCVVPDVEPRAAGAAAGVPVGIAVVTDFEELIGAPDVTVVMSDDDGFFSAEVEAPDRPGQHLVFAICDYSEGELEAVAAAEPVDEDGVIVDSFRVTQDPLSIALSDDQVEEGDEVVATFNRCQAENDFSLFELEEGPIEPEAGAAADPTPEELATDFPDLAVFLDGELIDTIEGTERHPTGTVDVPVTLDEVGEHEIKGVCTYQTFDLDLETIVEFFNAGGEGPEGGVEGAGAAAIDYPFSPEPGFFTWDEATTEAADTVTVVSGDVGGTGAEPVPAAPTYTG